MRLTELYEQVAVSLWLLPATLEELTGRDFLANRSEETIDRILFYLENKGWIYRQGDIYHTYKATADRLKEEYEL